MDWLMAGGIFVVLAVLFAGFYFSVRARNQSQHALLRNFPLLGRMRYVLEHLGPELRQYLFDGDRTGKPFSREDYLSMVMASKYLNTLVSFGSKRDYEEPGWYLRNALLPSLREEMGIDDKPSIETQRYVMDHDGIFHRREHVEKVDVASWTLTEDFALRMGEDLPHPWVLRGMIGMGGMSYGALGRTAIEALSSGLAMAGSSWMNTGEGGLSPHHLKGGAPIVVQIGPGLHGVRDADGGFDWSEFRKKAALDAVVGFELKLHQGAKIRGGHLEGEKVTPEIAEIRGVPAWQTINSPNRFPMISDVDDLFEWIARLRQEGGKPVGIKIVVGGPGSVDELALAMAQRGDGPDWITVDGGEGGSGATYREMADSVGMPSRAAIIEADDALRRAGVRDRVKIIASGKLFSADRIALALCFGADAVNVARGMMISVGCIQTQRCHSNTCPVGVATTDEKLIEALVVDEKQFRVLNYVTTLRASIAALAAAAGLKSPTEFRRHHAVWRAEGQLPRSAEDLFPTVSDAAVQAD
ncbi:MAG: FMN-binding glutamate synthase family protein [Myxococcota bacterium]